MKRKYLTPVILMLIMALIGILGIILNDTLLIGVGFSLMIATIGMFFDNTTLSDDEQDNLGF